MSTTQRACGEAVGLGRLDRGERGERRVAVVGAAAAVEAVALDTGFQGPRSSASRSSPAACRGGRRATPSVGERRRVAGIPTRSAACARAPYTSTVSPGSVGPRTSRDQRRRRAPCGRAPPIGGRRRPRRSGCDVLRERRKDVLRPGTSR